MSVRFVGRLARRPKNGMMILAGGKLWNGRRRAERGTAVARAHAHDDVGLRDGLALCDGERVILVGELRQLGWKEDLARNRPHRLQDRRLPNASGSDLRPSHAPARVAQVHRR